VDAKKLAANAALLMLEELATRGGRVRRKYWRTYRIFTFWLGPEFTRDIISKLENAGYVRCERDRVFLAKELRITKTLSNIEKRALELAWNAFNNLYIPRSTD